MLNPFFLQGSQTERSLVQDLINEQLRMYGVEVYYLPRKYLTEKTVIKEVIESKFDNAYPLEAYVENYDGYGENTTILSKFGIQALNEITLIVSKERFEQYISPQIKDLANVKRSSRPKEGDLIYFPLGDRIFEIKFVEHEIPFYQLQSNYTYTLKCELFRYEDEVINTGVDDIDGNLDGEGGSGDGEGSFGYTQTLTLVGSGSTASAVGSIVNGGVIKITVTNRGEGYTTTPKVAISSAPSGGITAIGIATMIGNLVGCDGTPSLKVQGVQLVNAGSGYTSAPGVVFVGGGGVGAAATTIIGDGVIGIVTVTSGGSGYSTAPIVTFSSPPVGVGTTATGVALINSSGIVTSVRLTYAGVGYTQAPNITFSSPSLGGTGAYTSRETVTGSLSGSTAVVRTWNSSTYQLEVSNITGTFLPGETIVGSASSATYVLRTLNTDVFNDGYGQNAIIEQEADLILDFTERNPFGEP